MPLQKLLYDTFFTKKSIAHHEKKYRMESTQISHNMVQNIAHAKSIAWPYKKYRTTLVRQNISFSLRKSIVQPIFVVFSSFWMCSDV